MGGRRGGLGQVRLCRRCVTTLAAVIPIAVAGGCWGSGQSASGIPTPVAWTSPSAVALRTPGPSPTVDPARPATFPIAAVTRYDDARPSIAPVELRGESLRGRLIVPCEVSGLTLAGDHLVLAGNTQCLPAVMVEAGQPNLLDPLTDGWKVMGQVWTPTEFVCCRP